eukprot:jgi/Ulvmu1/12293/UM088_0009.1
MAAPAASQGKPGSWDRRVAQAAMLQFISDEIAALASRDAARDAIEYLEAMEFYATHGKIPTPDKVCLGASEHPQSLADLMPITALQDGDSAAAASTMTINCDASILELESASTSAATSPTKSPMRAAAAANKMNDFCDRLAAAPTLMAAAAAEAASAPVAEECAVDLLAEEEKADTDTVADPAEPAQGCEAPAQHVPVEVSADEALTDEDLDDYSDSDYSDDDSDFELDDIVDGVLGATVGGMFGGPPAAPTLAEATAEMPAVDEQADSSSSANDSAPATPDGSAHDEALSSAVEVVVHTLEAVPDVEAATAGSHHAISDRNGPVVSQLDGKKGLAAFEGVQAVDAAGHMLPTTPERASAVAVKLTNLSRVADREGICIELPAGSSPAGTEDMELLCNPHGALGKMFAGMVLYKRREMPYFDESDIKLAKKESRRTKRLEQTATSSVLA